MIGRRRHAASCMTMVDRVGPMVVSSRRGLLAACGLGKVAGVVGMPRLANAQIMPLATPPMLDLPRHVFVGALVRLQNPGDRTWRGLRRQYFGSDSQQAAPDGLLPNDLDDPTERPSPIHQRVMAAATRILAPPDPALHPHARPRPQLQTGDKPMTQQELLDALRVTIQFYIRDASQDLMFAPSARVATVVLTEIVLYQGRALEPTLWPSGPIVSVETVVRANATEWLFAKLDAAVERALARLVPL